MHHFISVMFSLLVFTGLQVSVESAGRRLERSTDRHYISELTVSNGGSWGSWGHIEMCPDRTYAAGFSLKVEVPVNWDETALNGIRLHCIDSSKGLSSSYDVYNSIKSDVGSWGQWTDIQWCPSGFLTDFRLKVETPQGTGDDTAANNIMFECSGGSVLQGNGASWGVWGDWSGTCQGKWICGIRTKVEEAQGIGDDTALNDVRMYCCE